ncbi:MAG: transposase [Myxococcales bacterium]|nr:transposase [Myxococcales bacterium]
MNHVHGHRYKRHYGSPRMTAELKDQGFLVNHKRVARLMKAHGLCAKPPKKKAKTTDSAHALAVADNALARDFTVGQGQVR